MKKFFLIALFVGSLICGCDSTPNKTGSEASSNTSSDVTKSPANVMVLCDVSTSVSENDKPNAQSMACIRDMIKGCQQLLKHYPPGSRLTYYLIASNAEAKPFLDFTAPEVYQTSKYDVQDSLNAKSGRIKTYLDSAALHAENKTCILTSVRHAFDQFQNMSRSKRNELIIYSDMREQCTISPVGNVQMALKADAILDPDQRKKFIAYKGQDSWPSLDVRVHVIMNTPYMTPQVSDQIRDVWTQIFHNLTGNRSKDQVTFETDPDFQAVEDYL